MTSERPFKVGDRVWTDMADTDGYNGDWHGLSGTIIAFNDDEPDQVRVKLDTPPRGETARGPMSEGWVYYTKWLRHAPSLYDLEEIEAFLNTSIGGTDERQISSGDPQ